MIQSKKFSSLPPNTAKRKLVRLLTAAELVLRKQEKPPEFDPDLWPSILFTAGQMPVFDPWAKTILALAQDPANLSITNDLRHSLSKDLGKEHLEWDLLPPIKKGPDPKETIDSNHPLKGIKPDSRLEVYLHNLRSPFNVGSIFRTADAIGCKRILLSPQCPQPGNTRLNRSSMGTWDTIEWQILDERDLLSYALENNLIPVALELGGKNFWDWKAPDRILLILGSEELGVPGDILEKTEVISIPMLGNKASFNVGVSFGIAGSWWTRQKMIKE